MLLRVNALKPFSALGQTDRSSSCVNVALIMLAKLYLTSLRSH